MACSKLIDSLKSELKLQNIRPFTPSTDLHSIKTRGSRNCQKYYENTIQIPSVGSFQSLVLIAREDGRLCR